MPFRSSSVSRRHSLAALICFAAATPAFAGKDAVPDWVKAAAAKPVAHLPSETRAVVLLDETTLTVEQGGTAVEHHRRVLKILRPNGRDEGYISVPFDKDRKIMSMHVWSIGPDGHEYALKDKDLMDLGLPGEGSLYEDLKMRVADPPGRDPGGIIAYEYEQRTRPYVQEETWSFEDSIPRFNQSFTLELPAGYRYGTVWAHHPELKAADLEKGRYRWDMEETRGINLERVPFHPALDAMAGRMTVHYGPASGPDTLATWPEVGQWYDGLSRSRLQPTPEITAKAAALTAGQTDFFTKTEAIANYVQRNVRYFVVEMGIGGYQPHPAGEIFSHGYGDCKDKATVLSSMLSTVGIHAALMMVDSHRGVIDPAAPSVYGNHMITAIEIPEGYQSPRMHSVVTAKTGKRYLIFDPTWDKTVFGQLEDNLQGGYGVLLEGPATEAIRLPVLNPDLNTLSRTAHFELGADGKLKGTVVEKRFGDLAENSRMRYEATDQRQQAAHLTETLSRDLGAVELASIKVENTAALDKPLTTSFDLSTEHFGRSMGPLLMVRPRVLGTDGMSLERETRRLPIDLRSTRQETDDFTMELPDGYTVDEVPDPVKLDLGFAAYESASKVTGKELHYTRTYTVREISLPANRYADLQKLASVIEADEQSQVVLKKQ